MKDIYTVFAFCKGDEGGNAAGVALDGETYARDEKQLTAAKMGYSETVFVSKSAVADFKLEYFTPIEEVPLCGHATIATFSLMLQKGLIKAGCHSIETKAGLLKIEVYDDGTIMMEQTVPQYLEQYIPSTFASCIETQWIDPQWPIQAVSTGLTDILMPIDSVAHLDALRPNFEAMSALNTAQGVVGIHAFAIIDEPDRMCVCRNFAPRYAINEESATGTSSGALACYLFRYVKQQEVYIFEQGITMGQSSRIIVKIEESGGEIKKVKVGGVGRLANPI